MSVTHAVVMLITDHSVSVHVLQVTLPNSLKGRFWHSITIVHTSSTLKRLVTYGGMYEPPRNWRDINTYIPVAETTVIGIGKCMVTFLPFIDFIILGRMIHFRRAMEVMYTCSVYSLQLKVVPRKFEWW